MTQAKLWKRIQINVDPDLYRKIKQICYDHEMPMSMWIRLLIEEKVEEEDQLLETKLDNERYKG